MKVVVTVVVVLVTLTFAKTEEIKEENKTVPAFVKSLKFLHRGPPRVIVESRAVLTNWITQKLDHFDKNNKNTWQMRYIVKEHDFKYGGPMFIHLGGEWAIEPSSIQYGIFPDLAKEHKGMLFYTEHRYYGQSKPTSHLSVESLRYLNIKQALADLAHFIRTLRQIDSRLANSKVIISGCSYAATMVVWFSKLYPELMNGGWASSAPVLAQVDFKEYMEVAGQAWLKLGSQQCYNRLKNGITELENMFVRNRAAEATAMLKVCDSFNHHNLLDLWSLFGTISNVLGGSMQYQQEGDVQFYCNYLMSFKDDVTAISKLFLYQLGEPYGCVDVSYKGTLNYYMDSTYAMGASRPWHYQTCNEYGWFISSASKNQPFGSQFPALLSTTLCYDVFGHKYTNESIHQLIAETNKFFGGKNTQVKNVYVTHGAFDPWSAMGHGIENGATIIPRESHCSDMGSISSYDSVEMRASKERLVKLVRKWLA